MEDKQKNEWQEREFGALWKNEGRNQTYLTGKIGDQKVVIFSNKHKNKDNDEAKICNNIQNSITF